MTHATIVDHDCALSNVITSDFRSPYQIIGLGAISTRDPLMRARTLLTEVPRKHWSNLTGGSQARLFLPQLSSTLGPTHPLRLLQLELKTVMNPIIFQVRILYPELIHFQIGAIMSRGNAPSQYEGHFNKLHSDYEDRVYAHCLTHRPVSVIVALDSFHLEHLKLYRDTDDEKIESCIHVGQAIILTNDCLHAGGTNRSTEDSYRLFAYLTHDEADLPTGKVRLHDHQTSSPRPPVAHLTSEVSRKRSPSPTNV